MPQTIVGVDLGGTQMRAARFDSDFNLLERLSEPTNAQEGPDAVVPRLLDLIRRVIPDDPDERDSLLGIGVSVPGPINPHTGTIVNPPNLPGWNDMPVRKIIYEKFGCATYVGNDGNVAALAETANGAAAGHKYMIYLTVSTGIGSGIINDGRLIVGAMGLGGEAGHIKMIVNDEVTDLENAAAGPAIAREAVKRIQNGAESAIVERVNGRLDDITAKTVGEAATAGDQLAIDVITRAGYIIGLGIVSLMHLFNPQIVVVGGSVTKTGDLLFEPMRRAVRENAMADDYWLNVPIIPAALGDDVALIGAAALVTSHGGSRV
jgi:glucokinase